MAWTNTLMNPKCGTTWRAEGTLRPNGACTRWRGDRGQIVFADPRLAGQQLVYGLRGEVWPMGAYPDRLEIRGDSYVSCFIVLAIER